MSPLQLVDPAVGLLELWLSLWLTSRTLIPSLLARKVLAFCHPGQEWASSFPKASRNLSTGSASVACLEGSLLLWSLYALSTLHALNFPGLYKYFGDRKVWCKRGQVWGKKRSAPGHRCLCPSDHQHPKDESVKEREMGPQSLLKIYLETLLALAK